MEMIVFNFLSYLDNTIYRFTPKTRTADTPISTSTNP